MKKKYVCLLICLTLILSMCFATHCIAFAEEVGEAEMKIHCTATIEDKFTDDSVIVVLDSKISEVNKIHKPEFFKGIDVEKIVDLTARKINLESKDFQQILQLYLKNSSKEKVLQAIAQLEQMDGIYCAEPNYLIESTAVSNDPYFTNNSQWNLNGSGGIGMPSAWDITTGSKAVRVGIIDTGIAHHPDLNDNLGEGYDFYNDDNVTNDDEAGHGTQVAGIIGAVGNNARGVAGINWHVTLVPLQVSYYDNEENDYFLNTGCVIDAVNYAKDLWGTDRQIDILNYSGGGYGDSIYILLRVMKYEGLFVWSAGNEGLNVDNDTSAILYDLDNLISVGAIDKYNERSVWTDKKSSNYGTYINIYAPGGGLHYSEDIPTTNKNGSYSNFAGTSAAAPHVAGVAALILSINPTLTSADLKKLILDNVDEITISTPDGTQNVKKLNAYKALANTHQHKFKTTYLDSSYHTKSCECGYSTTESHAYDSLYKKYDGYKHWAYCSCKEGKLEAHVLGKLEPSENPLDRKYCILCKREVDFGMAYSAAIDQAQYVTANGSYILPNGVIVLAKEDFADYFNGTLSFINKNAS